MPRQVGIVLLLVFVSAWRGVAAEPLTSIDAKDGWKLATESKEATIYSRCRAGSPVKEFRAIGDIEASTRAVHAVIDDLDGYPSFMPYTAECRLIKRESDSIITYQ